VITQGAPQCCGRKDENGGTLTGVPQNAFLQNAFPYCKTYCVSISWTL